MTQAAAFLADKALTQMRQKLTARESIPIIPPKSKRNNKSDYNQNTYTARHGMVHFFGKLNPYRVQQQAMTKQGKGTI